MKRKFTFLIFLFSLFSLLFARENSDFPLTPGPKAKDRPSVCLVLAGGGAKGFAHLPIIELLQEMDIPVDMVVGTSIGAVVGGLYACGYTPEEIINEFDDVDWTPIFQDDSISPYEDLFESHSLNNNPISLNFGLDFSLKLGKGFSNGQNVYDLMKNLTLKYDSATDFNQLDIPFRAVVTDMLSGESYVLNNGDIAEAIRASMSLPGVFDPAEIDGNYYMDGGLRYNLAINVAKNMGYDIIIAVDISKKIRDNPNVYDSNPGIALLNTFTISHAITTASLLKDADLVITPDLTDYGVLDFKKAKLIFEEGRKATSKYKPALEEIRKRIYPQDYDKYGNRLSDFNQVKEKGSYSEKSYLVPQKLVIKNAYSQDENYIKNSFKKISGKDYTETNFQNFIQDVYNTGNYNSVNTRIYSENDETVLELILAQTESKSAKVVLGSDFQQTISEYSSTLLNLHADIQFRGLTGIGSVLALRGTFINDFGLDFLYFQPINPYLFIEEKSVYIDDKYGSSPLKTISFSYSDYVSYISFTNNLNLGFRTFGGNLLKTGPFFDAGQTEILSFEKDNYLYSSVMNFYKSGNKDYDISQKLKAYALGFYINYELDKQNRSAFSNKGVYLNISSKFFFPYSEHYSFQYPVYVTSIDLRDAIPVGKKSSLNFGIFAGAEITDNLKNNPLLVPYEGFSTFDRIYFPSVYDKSQFGTKKAAATLTFQFEPFETITIFGGDLIFRLTGTVGNVAYSWKDLTGFSDENYPLLWTGSCGIGLNLKSYFNVFLKGGITSTKRNTISPFLTLDIGNFSY